MVLNRGMRKALLLSLSAIMLASLAESAAAQEVVLRIDGGPPGSGKHYSQELLAEAIRKGNPDWRVYVVSGPPSSQVVSMIGRGQMDVVREGVILIRDARKGMAMGRRVKPVELAWTVPVSTLGCMWILLEELPINSVPELIEKRLPLRVAHGKKGAGPWYYNRMIMEKYYGVTFDEIEAWGSKFAYGGGAMISRMMRDGLIDATTGITSVPMSGIMELSKTTKLKVFSYMEPEVVARATKKGFVEWAIPAGTYEFTPTDTPILGVIQTILVKKSMDLDVAYDLTKAVWERRESLGSLYFGFKANMREEVIRDLAENHLDVMHPGATRYFVEQGILSK